MKENDTSVIQQCETLKIMVALKKLMPGAQLE